MTAASVIAAGSGSLEFVLILEGCEYIFATSPICEQTLSDGRTIVRGLKRDSIGFGESVYIPGGEIDIAIQSIEIIETAGPYRDAATRAFTGWIDSTTLTWIRSDVGVADTTIDLMDTSAMTVGDFLHVGTEVWKVLTIPDANTITVTRHVWDTTATAFQTENETTLGLDLDLIPVGSQPACYAGRRLWLYARSGTELTDSSPTAGTLLYRGVLGNDPELDEEGGTWSASVRSRLSLFDGKIGSDKGAGSKLRGLYYPDEAPFAVVMTRCNGANVDSGFEGGYQVVISGFFENRETFCSALTDAINAQFASAGWGGSCYALVVGDVWELYLVTPSSSPRFINFMWGSPVDGGFDGMLYELPSATSPTELEIYTVATSKTYRCGWGPFTLPRTELPTLPTSSLRVLPCANYVRWFGTVGSTWPLNRWYLDNIAGYRVDGTLVITPPATEGESDPEPFPAITIVTRDAGGWIESADPTSARPDWCAAGESQPVIDVALRLNTSSGTHLAGFIASVISTSPHVCNAGLMPLITNDDVASWTSPVIDAANGRDWLLRRDYVFGKAVKMIDVFKHECRAYGLFPYLNDSGKIAVKRITPDVDVPTFTIDATKHAPDGTKFGAVNTAPDGMIGSVVYKSTYDTREGKHLDEWTFSGRGILAAAKGKAQPLEIAPLVNPSGDPPPADEVALQAQSVINLYGRRRYVYRIPVTMQAHSLRIGDGVLLTVPQLPFAGARGSTTPGDGLANVRGTVIGRSWAYGSDARGWITVMIHGLDIAGYAPSARVASASGATTSWTLTLSAAQYGAGGSIADASYFLVGMLVRLVEWDSATPTERFGTVTSVSGNDVGVTLSSAWAGLGGATYNLRFVNADQGTLPTAQRRYAYVAGFDGHIGFDPPNDRPARIFA